MFLKLYYLFTGSLFPGIFSLPVTDFALGGSVMENIPHILAKDLFN